MSLYPSLEDLKVDKVIQVCVLLILNYFMACPLVKWSGKHALVGPLLHLCGSVVDRNVTRRLEILFYFFISISPDMNKSVCVCLCECMYTRVHVCAMDMWVQTIVRPEEVSAGAGVTGGCELPGSSPGNWTWIRFKKLYSIHLNLWAISPVR